MTPKKAPKKRIVRLSFNQSVKDESPLRRIFEQQGRDVQRVRIHLRRLEQQGIRI